MGKTEIAPLCSRNVYSWKQGNYVKLMLSEQNKSSLCTAAAAAAATAVTCTDWSFVWHKRHTLTLPVTLSKQCKNDSQSLRRCLSQSDGTLNEGNITCLRFCLQGHVTAPIHGRLFCPF